MTLYQFVVIGTSKQRIVSSGFEISNLMHLSVGQVDYKNHLSKCIIHLSEIYKAKATYVKIRNTPSDKSCRYSTCPTVIFTRLRRSDEWNFEPWNLACFANNIIYPWPQMMPTFSREIPPGYTPAICLCQQFCQYLLLREPERHIPQSNLPKYCSG